MAQAGRVAVVTGGTAGVGRATVRELANAGYDVAVLARGQAGLDAAVKDVENAGRRGLGISVDVADHAAVEEAAERVERELGEIYAWVNVAFVGSLAFFWDTDMDEYRRMTDVTYYGQVYGTRAALRYMRPRNRGVIVNVGSAMAYRSIPLQSAYCGAKHAVKGFSESVMTELAHEKSKVKVCMVQLPGLNTPQFTWNLNKMPKHPMPVPPIFAPELPARAIRFLIEHPRRNMWVGVATAYTILGERLAPKLVDIYLGRYGVAGQQTRADLPRRGSNLD
ncbi:MAG: SDR family oxidoreductase, partial [Nocardioidaceae bacterium]